MKNIKDLYLKYKEIINYLIFGILTTIIGLVSYYILVFTILNPNINIQLQIANIVSWLVAVTFAYIVNRKYVFESTNGNYLQEISNFFFSRILTLLLDMAIMGIGVSLLKLHDKVIKLISQVLVIVINYILSKILVFKKSKK